MTPHRLVLLATFYVSHPLRAWRFRRSCRTPWPVAEAERITREAAARRNHPSNHRRDTP